MRRVIARQVLALRESSGARLPLVLMNSVHTREDSLALLERAALAGLLETQAAADVAQAYRDFRRLQHVLRLNDTRYARVEPASVHAQREAVRVLWEAVFGPDRDARSQPASPATLKP